MSFRPRHSAVCLLLAALLLRALLPQGYMPSFSASGGPLVLCTLQGPVTLHDKGDQAAHAKAQQTCAFAFALGMAAAPSLSCGFDGVASVAPMSVAPVLAAFAAAPAASYSARAPPALV